MPSQVIVCSAGISLLKSTSKDGQARVPQHVRSPDTGDATTRLQASSPSQLRLRMKPSASNVAPVQGLSVPKQQISFWHSSDVRTLNCAWLHTVGRVPRTEFSSQHMAPAPSILVLLQEGLTSISPEKQEVHGVLFVMCCDLKNPWTPKRF